MKRLMTLLCLLFSTPCLAAGQSVAGAYGFSFTGIDGKPMPLNEYQGKVLLVVNTASKCGFTPQYGELEKLYQRYKDQGLVVIGVPSNQFGGQEPGDEHQISRFTQSNFHITFPLTQKTDIVGSDAHPFYQWAAGQSGFLGAPKWNFHKYLIGRHGEYITWFASTTSPLSKNVTRTIEKALTQI